MQELKDNNFEIGTWHHLCLNLGLNEETLNTIEKDKSDSNERLTTCLNKWLNRVDQVDTKGGATRYSLIRALESIGQKPVAESKRYFSPVSLLLFIELRKGKTLKCN